MRKLFATIFPFVFFLLTFFQVSAQDYLHNTDPITTCGGNYYDSGGPSSNYGNQNGNSVVKTFTSQNGNRLKFNFQQFVTEGGTLDYLVVYDGPTTSYPTLGVFQGSLAPFSIESSGTSLTFSFTSSFSNVYAGWAAQIVCTTAPLPVYNMTSGTTNTCGGMFYDNGGANADYPNFENRTQTFCSSNGQKIAVSFNRLETILNSGDTLWAFDGNSTSSPLLGYYISNSIIETLTSSGTCLTFRFKSDAIYSSRGWAAQLSCTSVAPGPQSFTQSTGMRATCDGIFTDEGGESGNYTNMNNGSKTQTFTSYNGNRLKINFQQFVTEPSIDYLVVYDGPNNTYPVIGVYSGSLSPFSIEGSGKSLTFQFTSSFSNTFAGWRGTFECTTPILPAYNMSSGTVNACSGMFYDNGGANGNYPNFENRTQTFCAGNGQKIQFNFNQSAFSLSGTDTLWVYDGNSTASNPLAMFVVGSLIEPLTSTGTCLTFRFKSIASPASGWAAEFTCVAAPPSQIVYVQSPGVRYTCGGLFTDDGGINNNYANLGGGTKTQTFTSYNGNRLKINFQQFITESGLDYLQIYDGPSINSPMIGLYQGTLSPFSVEGTGKSLTFRFVSSTSNSYAGWQGYLECTTPVLPVYNMSSGTTTACSGVFYDAGGSARNYPTFENRTQTFCSSNGQKIQFAFNPLGYGLTALDSLWVYDGNSVSSPLKGIYVVNSKVETLTSTGTCLTFRFKSVASTERGWQAILSCVAEAPAQLVYSLSPGLRMVCSGVFTDDGGVNGNYSNLSGTSQSGTFQSENGQRLSVVFNSFAMETNVDYLDIYDGPTTSFPRLARLTGTVASGYTYTSTGSQLTFVMTTNSQTNYAGWIANFACSGPALPSYNMTSGTINTCSGVFYDNGGGGKVYPNNENRTQTFCSDNGQKLVFDFTNFEMESNDTLLVYDGNSVGSNLIGVYSNSYLPEKITSTGTCLTFRFRSDVSVQYNGWKALISCTSDNPTPLVYAMNSGIRVACSGVFTDDGGLTANYSNGQNRVQTFQGVNGQRVRMNFQEFSTESGFDILKIYDGPTVTSPIIGSYSGNVSPGIVTSSGNSLTFSFISDASSSGNWAATIECAGPALTAYTMSSGTKNTCSGIFYDNGGVSSNYPVGENRVQTFCSDNGGKVQFTFNNNAFRLGGNDTLFAYDGNSISSPLLAWYVTSSYVEQITSSGTCVTFRFKSDGVGTVDQGWAALITCTSTAPTTMIYPMSSGLRVVCSGIFTDDGGVNGNYSSSQNRTQTFQSPNNNRLRFEFSSFFTENGFDYLDVYDGPSNLYPYLGRLTGNSSNTIVLSSGNSLTFRFVSDASSVSSGWIANISCAGPVLTDYLMANGTITACEGRWFDNGGPVNNYSNNLNLVQTFCSGVNKRMVFNFNRYTTNLSSNDTLFAYDGNSVSSPFLGAYVLSGEFEPIISSGTCLTFRFKSDVSNNLAGWSALFYCTDNPPQPEIYVFRNGIRGTCSGYFTDDGGVSGSYSSNQNKTFTFQSNTVGAKLQFDFTQFSTEACCDKLYVYDGPNISAPLLATYAGGVAPGLVTSTGSSMTFRFVSDASSVSSGWLASIACVSNVPLVGTLANGPFCAGGTLQIPFTSPTQSAGNTFSAQLSDANGTFSSPTVIGTLSGTTSGTLSGTLPSGLSSSGLYRIRIVSSSPANTGNPSAPFTILALPAQPGVISGLASLCAASQNKTYSIPAVPGASSYNWNVPSGSTIISGQGTTSIVVDFGTISGNISVVPINTCGNGPVRNLIINLNSASSPTASVSSNATGNTVCAGGNIIFSSTISAGSSPQYQWQVNGVDFPGATGNTFALSNLINSINVSLRVATTTGCFNPTAVTSSILAISVNPSVVPEATISSNVPGNSLCSGQTIIFSSSIVSGGSSPGYNWRVNGALVVGANGSTFSPTNVQNGDVVSLRLTSTANCAAPTQVVSNGITVIINQTVTPAVSISSNTGGNQVCGTNQLILSANTSNGGDTPLYQWFRNGSVIPGETGSSFITPSDLTGSTNFSVRLTSNAVCASPLLVTSSNFQVNAVGSLAPSVAVNSSVSGTICVGTSITFTANPVNGGSSPTYVWKVNGVDQSGQTGPTFTSSSLTNNDQVVVQITSNDPCANPLTATSTPVSVSIITTIAPSVTASSSLPGNVICAGQSITFTANPTNGGSNPGYQWTINGVDVSGATGISFSPSNLTNNAQVRVRLTSSISCASPTSITSTPISVTVNAAVAPSVTVSSSQGNSICQGSSSTLSATPTNGGTNPMYQWFADGNLISSATGATYQTPVSQSTTVTYTVTLTSNAACANPASATSSGILLSVNPSVTPSVSFTSNVSGNTICSGQSITFTASGTNGGANPQYQWLVNGAVQAGQTNLTFTTSTLTNGQSVTVRLTSNANCANPASVTSVGQTISVTPSSPAQVAVTSSATGNTICAGQSVTFEANPINGGTSPTYQWILNGVDVAGQTGVNFQSFTLANNDKVSVRITSNSSCANPTIGTSPVITMTVNPTVSPSVSIVSSPSGASFCKGTAIQFTANPTNGGANPTYEWRVNSVLVSGQTSANYTLILNNPATVTATLVSNAACASPTSVVSSGVVLGVNPGPTVTAQGDTSICEATGSFNLQAIPAGGSWSGSGVNSSGTFSPGAVGTFKVFYQYTDPNTSCTGKDSVLVIVKARPAITFPTMQPICVTATSVQISATPTGGTWTGTGISANGLFNPVLAGIGQHPVLYSITVNGCLATKILLLDVSPAPVVDIGGNETVCFSTEEVQFSGIPTGGTWSGNGVNSSGLFTPGFVTPGSVVTLTYTVTVNGCSASKTKQITVTDFSTPVNVNAGLDQTICISDGPFVLTGVVGSGGNWTGTGVSANGIFNPAVSGVGTFTLTYTVTFFQSPTCSGSDTKVITVLAAPSAPQTIGDTVCRQGPAILSASGPAGQFRWYTTLTGGTPISGQTSSNYTTTVLNSSTTYYVSQVAGSCESPRAPVLAWVNGFDNAAFTTALNLLTASPSNGQGYQWLLAGVPIANANQNSYTISQSGDYSVIIRVDGCADTSSQQFVLFLDTDKPLGRSDWKVFPNPAQHQLFVEANGVEEIRLLNVLGQVVLTQKKGSPIQNVINLDEFPNGVYWLEMKGLNRVEKTKVVIRK